MWKLLKKFIENEKKGIKQAYQNNMVFHTLEMLDGTSLESKLEKATKENYPAEFEIAKQIAKQTNVQVNEEIYIEPSRFSNGSADLEKRSITVTSKTLTGDEKDFIGTYAHELGHIKYSKLHKKLGKVQVPYLLSLAATTSLYTGGLIASAVIGDNLAIDIAKGAGEMLLYPMALNAGLIRTREFMADRFAYNATGLLPSEFIGERRHGIVGNISKVISDALNSPISGYPLTIERDIFCKVFGKKPENISFVERLENERANQCNQIKIS